ncbi:MAG: PKD domain-containing protein [Bacteroidetes bacterium]|nr:PKD domain-containing protein [Bacteroidota bacterium]NOG94639.1 PKD domain-containing protein [Bacteroidota bacterium]
MIVGGGGGGMAGGDSWTAPTVIGGNGGCPNGAWGTSSFGQGGGGGTTVAGGAGGAGWGSGNAGLPGGLAVGGQGGNDNMVIYAAGGGGGGGLYGGGGGGADGCCIGANGGGAGGGGSSLIPGGGGCNTNNNGNGYLTITYSGTPPVAGTVTATPNPICAGQTTTLTVTGSSGAIQWQVSTNGGGTWNNIVGATNTTYTTPALFANTCYRVAVTACGTTVYSNMVCITVNPIPVATATPANQTICSGQTTNIALTSNVPGTTFSWTVIQSGVTGASNGSGTPISQTLTCTGPTTGTATYTITPTANGCVGTPITVIITVNPIPVATATPSSQTICSGQTTNIALTSNVGGTTFNWTVTQLGVTGASNGSGNTIAQTLTTTGPTPGTATYTITPTANGCTGTPITVIITVNPTPVVVATPASQTFCSGGTTNIALTSTTPGTTFNWTVVQVGVTGASNGSGNTIAQTLTTTGPTPGTATYTITPTANGCVGTPITVIITVNPIPVAVATPASQTICSGTATNIALTSTTPGTTFNWTVVQSGVTGASNGSGNTIAQTLTTTGPTPGTATYTITPTANGCVGSPITVVITVNPTPVAVATPASQTFCSGGTTNIALTSTTPGTTFNWTVVQVGVTGASNGSGNTIAQTLTTTGPTPGTATYTITPTANGCVGSPITVVITVNPIPIPSFTTVVACPNQSTSFTNTTPGGIVSLNWSFPGATPSSGTGNNPSTTYPSGGTYNVTLIVTATGGCVDSITQQIIVPYTPVADFNFTQVCVGNATSFSNLSSVQNGSITGAQWVFGDGSPVDNSMNPSHTYANCGTYTVTLIVTSNDGCAASITKQVEVYCLPVASFTVNNVCDGNDASFVNTSQNGIAYSWNFGDGNTSTAQNPFHTYAAPGTYTVTLIVNNGPGCSDVFTSTVTIHPKPVADFNAPNACDGNLISFNNTSSILSGSIIGNAWNFGDGNSSTAQNPTHTYANSNIYNVTLIVVSDMGCTDTLTKPVTIYPNPVVSFNASDVCEGNAIAFAGSSSIIIGSSWNWNFGDGASGSGQNTSHNYAAPGAYSVTLVVTTANGCVDSVSKIVNVFQTPSASFAADTTSGCAPLCVNFTNLSSIGDNSPLTYAWNFGNGNGSSNTNGSQCYQNTGTTPLSFTVSLTVTSDKGCTDTYSQNNLITVFPVHIADLNMDRDSVSVFDPRIQFFDQSYGAISQYQWNFGGLGSSNDKNPDFSFPDTGAFNVTLWVTNSYGCSSSITKTIKVGAEFSIFIPNAFTPDADHKNEIFKPVGYGIQDSGYNFYIFDRWGELIFESHNLAEGWNGRAKNGSNLSPVGVYIWKLQFKDINNKTHSMMGHVSLIN